MVNIENIVEFLRKIAELDCSKWTGFRIALMVLLYPVHDDIDLSRCLGLSIVYDLDESILAIARHLLSDTSEGLAFIALLEECRNGISREIQFIKELYILEQAIQKAEEGNYTGRRLIIEKPTMNFPLIQEWFYALIQINNGEKPTTSAAVIIGFLMAIKSIKSTIWLETQSKQPESFADHAQRAAIIAMLISHDSIYVSGKKTDQMNCIKLSIIHVLPICITGDLSLDSNISRSRKYELEMNAMKLLHGPMGEIAAANDIYETYEAFVDSGENDGQMPSRWLTEESWTVRELIDVAYILQGLQNSIDRNNTIYKPTSQFQHPTIKLLVEEMYKKNVNSCKLV